MMNLMKSQKDLIDNLFDDFQMSLFKNTNSMKTDIKEVPKGYLLQVELPGINKNDVKVSVEGGYLTIEVSKKTEDEKKDEKYIRRERHYGMMSRSFYVGDITLDDIKGKFDKGILELEFPKKSEKDNTKKYLELK